MPTAPSLTLLTAALSKNNLVADSTPKSGYKKARNKCNMRHAENPKNTPFIIVFIEKQLINKYTNSIYDNKKNMATSEEMIILLYGFNTHRSI